MIQSLQALFKQATRRRLRIRAGLVIACWLLLNLQLAVAAHHGGQQQPVAPQVQIHHIVDGMMTMSGMENVGVPPPKWSCTTFRLGFISGFSKSISFSR